MPESLVLLEERGLFSFDRAAVAEIERSLEQLEPNSGPTLESHIHDLICLTAAEYSLVRWMPYTGPVLPVQRPLQVGHDDALLAFLKTNCSPIFCFDQAGPRSGWEMADVTAFSSDTAKLDAIGLSEIPPPEEVIGNFARAVDSLESHHRESESARARAIGESGVLRLQGFLWALKSSLPQGELRRAMAEAHDAFELSQAVGTAEVVV